MSIEKIFDFIVAATRKEEQAKQKEKDDKNEPTRALYPHEFYVDRRASTLIGPCRVKREHHRNREKHYVEKLEVAEKDLRENGVSVEVYDQGIGGYANTLSSGAVAGVTQNFQPRVDQKLLDAVKYAKSKMLEHREKAEGYEKWERAFACDENRLIRLSVDLITYFGLGMTE